ncbi:HAL9 Halotolerance protein 9 [Candida maltosa Xu316]
MDPPSDVYLHHNQEQQLNDTRPPLTHPPSSSNSTITQSTSSSSGNVVAPPPIKKRARISKACQYCRKKKIKCDGMKPCSNCVNSNGSNCEYIEDPQKKQRNTELSNGPVLSRIEDGNRKVKSKPTKNQTLQNLEDRLSRIENMLVDLTKQFQSNTTVSEETNGDSLSEIQEVPEEDADVELDGVEEGEEEETVEPEITADIDIESGKIWSHSIVNIFSRDCIESLLKNSAESSTEEDAKSLNSIAQIYNYYAQAFLDTVCQPIKTRIKKRFELMDSIFDNVELPLAILKKLDSVYLVNYICDFNYVNGLFEKYYQEKFNELENPEKRRSIFKWSELLIMSAAIGICVSMIIDDRNAGKLSGSNLINSLTDLELVEINSKCFYSMILYYNRLCFISEGLATVRGIILFVIYLEAVLSSIRTNLIPITIAIRYAQELGLHRQDCYQGLSASEQLSRKILWWFCEYYNVEYCFRTGQPINLSIYEVSSLEDITTNAIVNASWKLLEYFFKNANNDALTIAKIVETKATHKCATYMMYSLSKIRIRSFHLLYEPKKDRKIKLSTFLSNVEIINKEMEAINIPPLNVAFYDDPNFAFNNPEKLELIGKLDNGYENFLMIYFNYFLHLMTINRVDFVSTSGKSIPQHLIDQSLKFEQISIRSARTILHLVKSIQLGKINFTTYSWFLYHPFAAFVYLSTIYLNNPNGLDLEQDLDLLIQVSLEFCNHRNFKSSKIKRNCVRQLIYDLISRFVLKLVLQNIPAEKSASFYDKYKTLTTHLQLAIQFPEFFNSWDQ